jgi:ribosomal protein S18 acetylase RimI-like enzyme
MHIIKSLSDISFDSMFIAFSEAFKDYEMQLNKEALQTMLFRRGFVPELSFGAFEGNKIIAFTFNGIGFFNGIKTAYDTGTGTVKEYRGQGLATKIFEHSIPFLKEAKIDQYLLEVLQHNTAAVSVYKNLGFKVSREFNYFVTKADKIKINSRIYNPSWKLKEIEFSDAEALPDFCDFIPSWQNSFDAIARKAEDFKMIGVFEAKGLIGYCILEPGSGDISQIAVDKHHRRKGMGSFMLKKILQNNLNSSVKVINTEINCESINGFLQSVGMELRGKQFEMIKRL